LGGRIPKSALLLAWPLTETGKFSALGTSANLIRELH
jgi:hypothetical protein